MTNHDNYPNTHDHPFHMNKRGRRILGVSALTLLVAGGAMFNAQAKHDVKLPTPPLTEGQIYDNQIREAINRGPQDNTAILGDPTHEVGQDRTIGNAIIQEATLAGRTVDLSKGSDLVSITLSANAFDAENGPSYSPNDTFVLFEQDVNNDGEKELLAKSIDVVK